MKKLLSNLDYDWQNINIIEKNRLETRPFYAGYSSFSQALNSTTLKSEKVALLNGKWYFQFYESPFEVPKDFSSIDFGEIDVPAHWQFAGYGNPHYTDDVLLIPMQEEPLLHYENPTGVYKRTFAIELDSATEYLVRFDGVESAYHLYVNGEFVGYSQVSRNSAEFDLTTFVNHGINEIIVVVYQFCVGSVLEKQDMWTLAGIIRDVMIIERPKVHVSDFFIKSGLDDTYTNGILNSTLSITNNTHKDYDLTVTFSLFYKQVQVCKTKNEFSISKNSSCQLLAQDVIESVLKWSAETPEIYKLIISLEGEGIQAEHYSQNIGFRSIQLKNGLMLINGKYVKLRGMNRHDWSGDTGRVITSAQMLQDLKLMKTMNINAVRTAHYPNAQEFYELCNNLGFYVVSEADLECNQTIFWTDRNYLSESPLWTEHYLDRVSRMIKRDKNYSCIVIWSLGNESGYGKNFNVCYEFCKHYDPERLVHYEEDRQAVSADVYSSMYTNHADLEKIGQKAYLEKPHILCEYAHVLGNSSGGVEEYWDIINRYPRLQGAFVWEWIAHGIKATDGKTDYFKYGGDFGDEPNTGKFCTSGLLSPDRIPYPGWVQFRKAMEPIKTVLNKHSITVTNLYSFVNLDDVALAYKIQQNGKTIKDGTLDISGISPMSTKDIPLPFEQSDYRDMHNVFVTFTYSMKDNPIWALSNHQIITTEQFPLSQLKLFEQTSNLTANQLEITSNDKYITVVNNSGEYLFDIQFGGLVKIIVAGKNILKKPIDLNFWRAPIDNDKNQVLHWKEQLVQTVKGSLISAEVSENGEFTIRFTKIYLPLMKNWRINTTINYTFDLSGVCISVMGAPKGYLPDTLPRIGIKFAVDKGYQNFQWYGRGPEPNYPDSQNGSNIGLHKKTVSEMFVPYVVPQENGAVCDTFYSILSGSALPALTIENNIPLIHTVSPYSTEMLDSALHLNELKEDDAVNVFIDYNQHGLGSAGWGPEALLQHTLTPDPFSFSVKISLNKEDKREN